jgi:nitrous oxide reductase accessory protein NosL
MKKILLSALATVFVFASCTQPKPEQKAIPAPAEKIAAANTINIPINQLAMPTDTTCGMSLSDGIGDTLHVGDKIYGFCSTGCKESFVKQLSQK